MRLNYITLATSALLLFSGTLAAQDCNTKPIELNVQAEDYCFSNGIIVEANTGIEGELNVGAIDTEDYMTYTVNVPNAGDYRLQFRVSSEFGGGEIRFGQAGGGVVYGTVAVPSTGSWQTYYTLDLDVRLPAGDQQLAIVANRGGFNLDFWKGVVLLNQGGGDRIRIRNAWNGAYLVDAGDNVEYRAQAGAGADVWNLIGLGNGYYEIRNLTTGDYMHNQNRADYIVECSARSAGWWSSQWFFEGDLQTDDIFRIRNRWTSSWYLNVESQSGSLDASPISQDWSSAYWVLEFIEELGARTAPQGEDAVTAAVTATPNPATHGVVNVNYSGAIDATSFASIYDVSGRLVVRERLTGAQTQLSTQDAPGGLYLLSVETNAGVQTTKLVIE